MYYVDFGTGAGNFYEETLEKAMENADEGACYTQQDINIFEVDDQDNISETPIMCRKWWGYQYQPEEEPDENPICFGNFGFYGDWIGE